jgi:hypothetical protein
VSTFEIGVALIGFTVGMVLMQILINIFKRRK